MSADYAEVQRLIRLACAPEPGDPTASHKTCVDCGERFWDWTEKWRRYCADCGAERQRAQWTGVPGRRRNRGDCTD